MSDLPAAGTEAPAFSLTDRQGGTLAFDGDADAPGATLLFFFKHDCATCELTAPLVERLHRALGPHGLRVTGVSQDPDADTAGFVERHGLSFDVALDADLTVSADYGFDAVPARPSTTLRSQVADRMVHLAPAFSWAGAKAASVRSLKSSRGSAPEP